MKTRAEMAGFVSYTSKTLVKYATKSKHIVLPDCITQGSDGPEKMRAGVVGNGFLGRSSRNAKDVKKTQGGLKPMFSWNFSLVRFFCFGNKRNEHPTH